MNSGSSTITPRDRERLAWLRARSADALHSLLDRTIDSVWEWLHDFSARLRDERRGSLAGQGPEVTLAEVERLIAVVEPEWSRRGPTLRTAERELWAAADTSGARCPVCAKWVRRYWFRLNGSMGRALRWLVLASTRPDVATEEGWVHVPTHGPRWLLRTNQHSTLRHFGLAERRDTKSKTSPSSGYWRPTEIGFDFVAGRIEVPDRVLTYNGEAIAIGEQKVGIGRILPIAFDYTELMAESGEIPQGPDEIDPCGVLSEEDGVGRLDETTTRRDDETTTRRLDDSTTRRDDETTRRRDDDSTSPARAGAR